MRLTSVLTGVLVFILSSAIIAPAQSNSSSARNSSPDEIFTLNVDKTTSAKDVQVRYFFTGEFGGYGSSVADSVDGNRIVIKTGVEGKSAKTFRLIAYAPGCQLVTLAVDDLTTSNRQGEFQCQKLATLELHARVDGIDVQRRADAANVPANNVEIEALYMCDWAMDFFGIKDGAISPLVLGKTKITQDGTFTIDVPDFTSDPSYPRTSGNAGFMFVLRDPKTGNVLGSLTSVSDAKNGGIVPVAASYPELAFSIKGN